MTTIKSKSNADKLTQQAKGATEVKMHREIYTDWAKDCGIDSRVHPVVAGGLSQGTGTGAGYNVSHTVGKAPGMVTLDSVSYPGGVTICGEMTPDVAEAIAHSLLYHAAEARKLRGY